MVDAIHDGSVEIAACISLTRVITASRKAIERYAFAMIVNPLSCVLAAFVVVTCTLSLAAADTESPADALPIDIAEEGLDGRTWFVSLDGNDDNAGTEDAPLRTLQAAADRVSPGETVLVRGGLYAFGGPDVPLTIRRGGTADAWVRFASYPGETAAIEFNAIRGIKVESSYVVVEGFELDGRSDEVDPIAAT